MNHYKLITLNKENGNAFFLDIIKRFWLAVLFKKANIQWNAKLILSLLCIIFAAKGYSQQTINVTNHSAKINGMLFEYAIGEMTLISTEKNTNLIVTQGFLQPITQQSSTSLAMNASENVTDKLNDSPIKVYPNPSSNIVFVETIEPIKTNIVYQLFDALGKEIFKKEIQWEAGPNKYALDLKPYAAGPYYLMIHKSTTKASSLSTSFKIQKTN